VSIVLYSNWRGWSRGTFFYNNIFFAEGPAQFAHSISRNTDGAYVTEKGSGRSKNNVFDSNLYFGNLAPEKDAHALTADPRFRAPGTGKIGRESLAGYRLPADSPAAGSGMLVENSGGHDFWGEVVPSCGRTDRGASQSNDCGVSERSSPPGAVR